MSNMNDVARIAGVSRGSVSNYINGKTIRESTKVKIEKAIKKLNYVPNANAQALKTRYSSYVIFIIPTVNTPFFSKLSYYIQIYLKKLGYKMILCNSNSCPKEEIEYIQLANSQKVSGIITMSYSDISELVAPNTPLVSIEKKVSSKFPLIISDNYQGGTLAAKKLHQLGAKKLLFVSKSPIKDVSFIRQSGFIDYCVSHHLNYEKFIATDQPKFIDEFESFILKNKINNNFRYDGVFSDSDEYASSFWHLLVKHKILVPDTVQVIGFDASNIYPRQPVFLSSIYQPIKSIARNAINQLEIQIDYLNKNEVYHAKDIILPVSFKSGITTK